MGLKDDIYRKFYSMTILFISFIFSFLIMNSNSKPHQEFKIEAGSYSAVEDTTNQQKSRSNISVHQTGTGNTATIRQSGGADGTTEASVRMTGSGNTTEISFNGVRGDAKIDMAGDDNLLLIRPLSIFDIFTLQFSKKPPKLNNNNEAPDDFLMIFRNLEDTLQIHQ